MQEKRKSFTPRVQGFPHHQKICSSPHLENSPPVDSPQPNLYFYLLILILIDVQYSHKAVFSFKKGSDCQNHSSSGSQSGKKTPPVKFLIP